MLTLEVIFTFLFRLYFGYKTQNLFLLSRELQEYTSYDWAHHSGRVEAGRSLWAWGQWVSVFVSLCLSHTNTHSHTHTHTHTLTHKVNGCVEDFYLFTKDVFYIYHLLEQYKFLTYLIWLTYLVFIFNNILFDIVTFPFCLAIFNTLKLIKHWSWKKSYHWQ